MPRQPRLILPDVAVHIIQRGNNRMACFRAESDYLLYLAHLCELSAQLQCAVHAYCLMTNHVHLLVTPSAPDTCTVLMRDLGQRYVQYFNRRYERTGTLWEGRFRSCVTESAAYVLACYRYIELNPVRAGMVSHPTAYRWSSYAVNAGARSDPLISPHGEFIALGSDCLARQAAYRSLVDEALHPSILDAIRSATNGGYPLVSESFKTRMNLPEGRTGDRGRPGRPPRSATCPAERKSGSDPDLFSAGGAS
jgi:putative transposase